MKLNMVSKPEVLSSNSG